MDQGLFGLFEIYQREPHSFRHDAARIKDWLLSPKRAFHLSLTFSLILHGILIGYVSFSSYSLYRHNGESELIDLKAILSVLAHMKMDPGSQLGLQEQMSEADESEILKLLTRTPLFDASVSEEEREALSKKLMEGYFELKSSRPAAGYLPKISLGDLLDFLKDREELGLGEKGKFYSPGRFSDDLGPVLFKFNKESERQLKRLARLERYEKEVTPVIAGMVTVSSESGRKDVPAEYYFRDCPYDQILARGASLFYMISGFPSLDQEPLAGRAVQKAEGPSAQITIHQGDLALFIIRPAKQAPSPERIPGSRPPLIMSPDRVEETLDNLMEFREDQQLDLFAATYLKKYDPDDDILAGLTRDFVYENLSSVFVIGDSFSAAFDFLEELFYNKELQGYFLSYWKENPRTKTGVEFLLILASLYDFERRAVTYLFDSYEIARKILDSEDQYRRAFNQRAKALVLEKVGQEFIREMKARGIGSLEDVIQEYRDEEIKIYQFLTDMGGKPRDRALYAWGRLLWDAGMYAAAVQKWKDISDGFAFATYQEIRHLLTLYDNVSSPVFSDYQTLVPRINRILEWKFAEDSDLLLKRLLKYEKWKKRTER